MSGLRAQRQLSCSSPVRRGWAAPHSSLCRSSSSGGSGSERGSGGRNKFTGRAGRSTRLSELAQAKRVAQRQIAGQKHRPPPPPPMGMPLAHYWAVRIARANMRFSIGGSGGGGARGDLAASTSYVQHEIEAELHSRAAWDSTPAEGAVAELSGWNNHFGGDGAEVSLSRPDPLPQHVLQRRARSCAWDIDLYYPPKPTPPVDPYAAKNREQASVLGAWHQLRQSYRI